MHSACPYCEPGELRSASWGRASPLTIVSTCVSTYGRARSSRARACSVDRQTQALSPAIVRPTALHPGVQLLFWHGLDRELALPPLGSCQAATDQSLTSRDPVSARIAAYVVRRGQEPLDLRFLSPTRNAARRRAAAGADREEAADNKASWCSPCPYGHVEGIGRTALELHPLAASSRRRLEEEVATRGAPCSRGCLRRSPRP
jgi:hypothetical protein